MSGSASTGLGGTVNIAQLISALSPIFLGSGVTTSTTGPQSSTTTGTAANTNNSTSTSSINPAALASLTNIANTATANSTDASKTTGLVNNILTESAQAFAPVMGEANSSGLYNTSTLSLLSSEAQARATAAASQAVLNYQTSQQQIATNANSTIAADTKTTTTTGNSNTVNAATTATAPVINVKQTAPTVSPENALLTLGAGIIGNKLLGSSAAQGVGTSLSNAASNALSNVGTNIVDAGDSISNALGIPGTPIAQNLALLSPGTAPIVGGSDASATGGLLVAGSDPAYATLGVGANVAAPTATAVGTDAASNLLGVGASDASLATDVAATSSAVAGATDAGVGAVAGADAATALDASGLASAGGAISADAAGSTLASGAGTLAADAGAVAADTGAGAAAVDAGATVASGAAADAGGIFGTLSSIFGGGGFGEAISGLLAAIGWVICTELKRQGKMSESLYRYGYVEFNKYPSLVKLGYWIWGIPVTKYIRKYPHGFVCKIMESIFNARVNNIGYRGGNKKAKWTVYGWIVEYGLYYLCYSIGFVLIILQKCRIFTPTFGRI